MTNKQVQIRLADFRPHPRNYNQHDEAQVQALALSLGKFGQRRSIVVWRDYLVAGHGLAEAAQSLGWEHLNAEPIPDEWEEERVLAYMVADNELAKKSDPDQEQLAALLLELREVDEELLAVTGWDGDELETLLGELGNDYAEEPFEFDEYDESVAGDVEMIECPHCKKLFPR